MKSIVPEAIKLAARRAYIRTMLQGYRGAIVPGGVSAATLLSLAESPNWWVISANVVAWVVGPQIMGLTAWLDITSKGIPDEYSAAADVKPLIT